MFAPLAGIPDLILHENLPLAGVTRFGLGGPVNLLIDAYSPQALEQAVNRLTQSRVPFFVIGGGSNLVVADEPFPGVVLRYREDAIRIVGTRVTVGAGAKLQDLVDATVAGGLQGLETMTGIPGWLGGALYGNAGAYGHSLDECVESVVYFDHRKFREIDKAACQFRYRESIFKVKKDWIVVTVNLRMTSAPPVQLEQTARAIREVRDAKYPPTMRCAGSIFKNLLWIELPETVRSELPAKVVREGKVPSAYFLEIAGAKGLRQGGIEVADYHANLIYNAGGGTARDVRFLIKELKQRVRERFGIELEEEIQYLPEESGKANPSLKALRSPRTPKLLK